MINTNFVVSGGKIMHKIIQGVNKQNHDKKPQKEEETGD
jgi:hypothetical protein